MNHILIIDDNPMDVALQRRVLARCGRFGKILSAGDGQEAIDLFQQYADGRQTAPADFPPLIVLLDLNMPVLDGFGFLDRFAKLMPAVREQIIMVLSSSNAPIDRERAEATELVERYLVKPLTVHTAREIANTYVGDDPAGG